MLKDWSSQKVLIMGAARQGTALARYLVIHGAQVTLNDQKPAEKLGEAIASLQDLGQRVHWVFGSHPLELLEETSLVCVSGGVPLSNPLVAEARRRGIPLSNDSQVFLEATPCKVIGITGSAGKTTTTTLVGRMAMETKMTRDDHGLTNHDLAYGQTGGQAGGRKTIEDRKIFHPSSVFVGGNIGAPLIAQLDEMEPGDLAVMEISSFQLELMTRSPQVAAVLNVTPNHLDRHGTMEAYTAAKKRILEFQNENDAAVLGRDDPGAIDMAGLVKGRLFTFGLSEPESSAATYIRDGGVFFRDGGSETRLFDRSSIRLRGEHNLLNVLAACALTAAAGLPVEAMRAGLEGFSGVPHRLEFVRRWSGADWYNDSIATAPERAMAAIRAFDEPLVLLAGGRDKDLPWQEFAALARQRVDHLILFGEAADKIARAMGEGYPLIRCARLREAVLAAKDIVKPGDVVLLSPGGTSFDEFKDFEERGECFRQLVMSL